MIKRWTVQTPRGAFLIYARSEAAARAKMTRRGFEVVNVKPRGYVPPKPGRSRL